MLAANKDGYFPYTPATNLLQGLRVAIELLHAEGLETYFCGITGRPKPPVVRFCSGAWKFSVAIHLSFPAPLQLSVFRMATRLIDCARKSLGITTYPWEMASGR